MRQSGGSSKRRRNDDGLTETAEATFAGMALCHAKERMQFRMRWAAKRNELAVRHHAEYRRQGLGKHAGGAWWLSVESQRQYYRDLHAFYWGMERELARLMDRQACEVLAVEAMGGGVSER